LQRQWAWSPAEEIIVDSKEESTTRVLDEVGSMEAFLDNVADRVKVVKEQLDHLEDEASIHHLKDSTY
jgi:archaellum component FlaC